MAIEKENSIVLRVVKYSDSSLILECLTDRWGIHSFIVSGVKPGKSRMKPSYFQPLQVLETVSYHKSGDTLSRIKEVRPLLYYRSLPFNVRKAAIGQFMTELLRNSVREAEKNDDLFQYVLKALKYLDETEKPIANFPLFFSWGLCIHLGILPNQDEKEFQYFDMQNGTFSKVLPLHHYYLEYEDAATLFQLLQIPFTDMHLLAIKQSYRSSLLEQTIKYYRLHLDHFKDLRSPEILKLIFS